MRTCSMLIFQGVCFPKAHVRPNIDVYTEVGAFISKDLLPKPEATKIFCRVNGCGQPRGTQGYTKKKERVDEVWR